MNSNAAASILEEGAVVRTKPGGSNTWYRDIVYGCSENIVYTALMPFHLESLVMPESGILLKYSNEFYEYLFEGKVRNICPDFPGYITIQLENIEELINTRNYHRVETYIAAVAKSSWDEEQKYGVVTNICQGGAAFTSNSDLDYGEEIEIGICLSDYSKTASRGKIVRKIQKGSNFDYSIQFTDISEEDIGRICDYMASLEEERSKMQSYFFDNIKSRLDLK